MSVDDDDLPFEGRTFSTKASLADYLEAQADELETLAVEPDSSRQVIVAIIAERLADVAREHGLEFVAERFDRFRPPYGESGAKAG